MAVPERPITARAVRRGPRSWTITTTITVPTNSVRPPRVWRVVWMTTNERRPLRRMTSGTAWRAVKRSWLSRTRSATRRPAPGREGRAATASNANRAGPPRAENRRVVPRPMAAKSSVTPGSGPLWRGGRGARRDDRRSADAAQPLFGLRVPREGGRGAAVVVRGPRLVAPILIEERAAVEGQRVGRDVPPLRRLRHL